MMVVIVVFCRDEDMTNVDTHSDVLGSMLTEDFRCFHLRLGVVEGSNWTMLTGPTIMQCCASAEKDEQQ